MRISAPAAEVQWQSARLGAWCCSGVWICTFKEGGEEEEAGEEGEYSKRQLRGP